MKPTHSRDFLPPPSARIPTLNRSSGAINRLATAVIIAALSIFIAALAVTKAAAEPTQLSRTLNIAVPESTFHFNSAIMSGTATGVPAAQLFASLLRVDREWKFHPYLAKSWEIAEDGRTVRFDLREGAKFHDGKPITSADVAFSIQTVKEYHPFNTMLAAVESVETPGPYTVILHLSKPSPIIELVAASPMLPILPKHVYGDGQPIRTHPANWQVVGAGPFKLDSVADDQIVLKKFDDFFIAGHPLLEELNFKIIDSRTLQIAFETGRVQLEGFNSDVRVIEELEKNPDLVIDSGGYAGVGASRSLMFNMLRPPLDNPDVRRAIALTIDKETIAKTIFLGRAGPLGSPIYPGTPFYFDVPESNRYDPDEANRLLDAAGLARDNRGIRFSIGLDIYTDPRATYNLETAEFMKRELLDKIGVDVNIVVNTKIKDYNDHLSNWNYDLALIHYFNWGDPAIGVHRMYDSKNIRKGVMFSNMTSYSDPIADALMAQAALALDIDTRRALYQELQEKLVRDMPLYPLSPLPFVTIHSRNLAGLDDSIWGLMFPFDNVHWVHDAQ